jgi:hypothetical protein
MTPDRMQSLIRQAELGTELRRVMDLPEVGTWFADQRRMLVDELLALPAAEHEQRLALAVSVRTIGQLETALRGMAGEGRIAERTLKERANG